jgi:hypothetical protein
MLGKLQPMLIRRFSTSPTCMFTDCQHSSSGVSFGVFSAITHKRAVLHLSRSVLLNM